jgi:hypothetical protein
MSFLLFYGNSNANIGSYDAFMYECPYCQQHNSTHITVFARYYHLFWIPIFPYERHGIALCTHCGAERNESKFGPKLVQEFRDNKRKFRYPWWTWSWTLLFISFIVAIVIIAPKS